MTSPDISPTSSTVHCSNPRVALLAKRERLLSAWKELAPNDRFGDMTLAQFRTLSLPAAEVRTALAESKARISSLINRRNHQATALNSLLKRVATAVCSDERFGDNSQLYRAMGFVPMDERNFRSSKSGMVGSQVDTPAAFFDSSPRRKRGSLLERYHQIAAAWETSGVDALNGITLQQLKLAANELLETVQARLLENSLRKSLVGSKMTSDSSIRALMKRVVGSVIGSSLHGENSALYRAMGYIPASERRRPQSPNRLERM